MSRVAGADLDEAPTLPSPLAGGSQLEAVDAGADEPAAQVNFED
jgi:hypothetical protein